MKKNERKKVYEELTNMKVEIKSIKMGSSFCSQQCGEYSVWSLGSGTFARPPPLGLNWREN